MKYNETKIEHLFNNVRIQQFGRGCFIEKKPAHEDIDAAYAGLESCKQILASGEYNLVVLDELTIAPVSYTHLDVYKRQPAGRVRTNPLRCNSLRNRCYRLPGNILVAALKDVYKRQV